MAKAMSRGRRRPFDLFAAFAAFALIIAVWASGVSAREETIRELGHNIDSGAYELTLGVLLFVPMGTCFLIAWLTGVRTFRWIAFGWPFAFIAIVSGSAFVSRIA